MKTAYTKQRGMTLIEVLAALAIGAVLLVGLASLVENSLDDMKGQQAAYYQAQVVDAARRYLDKNAADVATLTPAGAVLPITLAQLKAGKFLPDNFAATNPYRQGTCVLVRRPDPVNYAGQFDALIVTTGGDKIGDKDVASVAMLAGSGGGYVSTAAFGVARGASWNMPTNAFRNVTCPGDANAALRGTTDDGGHLISSLFYDGAAQQAADFLYRERVPGRPEANTLGTPLLLAGGALVQAGTSCLVDGVNRPALALDVSTRAIVTCGEDDKWALPSQWKAPVATYDALATVTGTKVGDVRMVMDLSRAFAYSAAGWVALAVDQNGNFAVPNEASVGKLTSQSTILAKGHMTTEQDLHVGQDAFVERNAQIKGDVEVIRGVKAAGVDALRWMSTPAVNVWEFEHDPGEVCNYEEFDSYAGRVVTVYPYGTIVTDRARRPMVCGPDAVFIYTNGPA